MNNHPSAIHPPDPRVNLRPVRYADIEAIQENCWPTRPLPASRRLVLNAQHNAIQGYGLGVVALSESNEIVGYGQLTLWPSSAEISDLAVAEPYRRRGLGTAIIQYLMRAACDMHADAVDIGAALTNPGALALYRRLGFQDDHTLMLDLGSGEEPVIYLRLRLRQMQRAAGDE